MLTKKPIPTHLPALRSYMGDWVYYVTSMRMSEVARLIRAVAEVHSSPKLCEWIQRRLEDDRAFGISEYLITEKERFFGSIVVGVYGGEPKWSFLKVGDPHDELSDDEESRLNSTVGVLTLTGAEKLFPIDGQHRVAGIKAAIDRDEKLMDEEVTVIVVGHARNEAGRVRTRRLFVTLNKRARPVSPKDIVALDEDNGLAITARRMVDEFALFREGDAISFSKTTNIPKKDAKAVSSILGIYQLVNILYPRSRPGWPIKAKVTARRPADDVLEEMYEESCQYWNILCDCVKEYRLTLRDQKKLPGEYRTSSQNHLLFRPAGQQAFAGAVACMMGRGVSMEKAIRQLVRKSAVWLSEFEWHYILWDPVGRKMLKEVSAAEALLLESVGQAPKTARSGDRLAAIREAREEEAG